MSGQNTGPEDAACVTQVGAQVVKSKFATMGIEKGRLTAPPLPAWSPTAVL